MQYWNDVSMRGRFVFASRSMSFWNGLSRGLEWRSQIDLVVNGGSSGFHVFLVLPEFGA